MDFFGALRTKVFPTKEKGKKAWFIGLTDSLSPYDSIYRTFVGVGLLRMMAVRIDK